MMELKPQGNDQVDWDERRAHPRELTQIGVKLRRSARMLFSGGQTVDVSCGGASIEVFSPREAQIGERIAIAFEHMHCPVTRAAKMIGASVVRTGPQMDGRQTIAIQFDAPQSSFDSVRHSDAA